MRVLVTGGAGFIGSHLIDVLMEQGHDIICVDAFYSGKKENIAHHLTNKRFTLLKQDVRKPIKIRGGLDRIYHLACPASPQQYQFDPVLTLETAVLGMSNVLQLARKAGARVVYSSTSEVYGDPLEHPQKETYFGNVDPIGQRACYDEGKRAAEALAKDYHEQYGVDVRIVRIFNTYGPRMMFNDGRVLSNFILQALTGENITVHGDGTQSRSFCYVSDLVDGLMKRMEQDGGTYHPVNLGNPDERTILAVAEQVIAKTNSSSKVIKIPYDQLVGRRGDPKQRCADISRAMEQLKWEPTIGFDEGLQRTIVDFSDRLKRPTNIVVFSPSFFPVVGPAEKKALGIMENASAYHFHVLTSKQVESHEDIEERQNQTIYRLGSDRILGKVLFPVRAALKARKLRKKHQFPVAWALMAGRGGLAAAVFSRITGVPVLLSVFEEDVADRMIERGTWFGYVLEFIFRGAHRWQVIGNMTTIQQAWLEDEHVQAFQSDADAELMAKRTKELFSELEIYASRV